MATKIMEKNWISMMIWHQRCLQYMVFLSNIILLMLILKEIEFLTKTQENNL